MKDTIFLRVYTLHVNTLPISQQTLWIFAHTNLYCHRLMDLAQTRQPSFVYRTTPPSLLPFLPPPFEITTSLLQNKPHPLCLALNDPSINNPQGSPIILLISFNPILFNHPSQITTQHFMQNCSSIILLISLRLLHSLWSSLTNYNKIGSSADLVNTPPPSVNTPPTPFYFCSDLVSYVCLLIINLQETPDCPKHWFMIMYRHQILKSCPKDKGSIQNAYRKSYKNNRVISLCTSSDPSINIVFLSFLVFSLKHQKNVSYII